MTRFEKIAKELGFRIVPVYALINNIHTRRPDINVVQYKGHHVMTIPSKILNFPDQYYKTLEGIQQPMYFDLEHKLRNWKILLTRTPHLQGLEEKKRKIEELEYNIKHYA